MDVREHILVCLAEECIEVVLELGKQGAKSLRFGVEDTNFLKPEGPNNRERMIEEANDLVAVLELMVDYGILPPNWQSEALKDAKKEKVAKCMEYAREKGALA